MPQEAFIVAATRTAGGRRGGRLSGWHPVDLAAEIINELVERTSADPALIDDVIMGCVQQIGEQSVNIGRNAVLASKLPNSVPGTSVDRQCGSSQQALHFAAQAVMSGTMDCVIAAGVESMSRIPMTSPGPVALKAGLGQYMSPQIQENFGVTEFTQFLGAEMMAEKYDISKDAMDNYAYQTTLKSIAAINGGHFDNEILSLQARIKDMPAGDEIQRILASLSLPSSWVPR